MKSASNWVRLMHLQSCGQRYISQRDVLAAFVHCSLLAILHRHKDKNLKTFTQLHPVVDLDKLQGKCI